MHNQGGRQATGGRENQEEEEEGEEDADVMARFLGARGATEIVIAWIKRKKELCLFYIVFRGWYFPGKFGELIDRYLKED